MGAEHKQKLNIQMNGQIPKEERTHDKETETSKLIQKEKAESGNVHYIKLCSSVYKFLLTFAG